MSNQNLPALLADPKQIGELEKALPENVSIIQFKRWVLTYYRTNQAVLDRCDPLSVLAQIHKSAGIGLPIDGRMAHIVPFGKEATLMIDYKGFIELAKRSANIKGLCAELVYENDKIEFGIDSTIDSGAFFIHKPNLKERGEIIGAYSYAVIDSTPSWEYMTKMELDKIRSSLKSKNSGAWANYTGEMYKKVVIKRHLKKHSFSPEFNTAVDVDNDIVDLEDVESPSPLADVNAKVKALAEKAPAKKKKAPPKPKPVIDVESPEPKPKEVRDQITEDKGLLIDEIMVCMSANQLGTMKVIKAVREAKEDYLTGFELKLWDTGPVKFLQEVVEALAEILAEIKSSED